MDYDTKTKKNWAADYGGEDDKAYSVRSMSEMGTKHFVNSEALYGLSLLTVLSKLFQVH